jgi:hypothetical protein
MSNASSKENGTSVRVVCKTPAGVRRCVGLLWLPASFRAIAYVHQAVVLSKLDAPSSSSIPAIDRAADVWYIITKYARHMRLSHFHTLADMLYTAHTAIVPYAAYSRPPEGSPSRNQSVRQCYFQGAKHPCCAPTHSPVICEKQSKRFLAIMLLRLDIATS